MGVDSTPDAVVEMISLATPQFKTAWESEQKECPPFVLAFDEEGGPIYVPSEAVALATPRVTITSPTEQERKADRRAVCLAAVVLLAGLFIAPMLWCLGWAFIRHRNKHARRLGKASIILVVVAMILAAIVVALHLAGHHHRHGWHRRDHHDGSPHDHHHGWPHRHEPHRNGEDGRDGNDGHDGRHNGWPHRHGLPYDGENDHDGNDGNDGRRPRGDGPRRNREDGHDGNDGHHRGLLHDEGDSHDGNDARNGREHSPNRDKSDPTNIAHQKY